MINTYIQTSFHPRTKQTSIKISNPNGRRKVELLFRKKERNGNYDATIEEALLEDFHRRSPRKRFIRFDRGAHAPACIHAYTKEPEPGITIGDKLAQVKHCIRDVTYGIRSVGGGGAGFTTYKFTRLLASWNATRAPKGGERALFGGDHERGIYRFDGQSVNYVDRSVSGNKIFPKARSHCTGGVTTAYLHRPYLTPPVSRAFQTRACALLTTDRRNIRVLNTVHRKIYYFSPSYRQFYYFVFAEFKN